MAGEIAVLVIGAANGVTADNLKKKKNSQESRKRCWKAGAGREEPGVVLKNLDLPLGLVERPPTQISRRRIYAAVGLITVSLLLALLLSPFRALQLQGRSSRAWIPASVVRKAKK